MLLTRIFDGITDLIMGAIVDKTHTKWGKARPWILWTAPFMAIALVLVFNVPGGMSSGNKLLYAYLTYIFQNCIVYTANNLPYNALLSRMTLDVQDRGSAASMRFVMTQLTTLVINAVTAGLLATVGWLWLSIVYGIVAMIMFIIMGASYLSVVVGYLGITRELTILVTKMGLSPYMLIFILCLACLC